MGREIRRVIPNWEHPLRDCPHSPWRGGCDEARKNAAEGKGLKCFHPLYDEDFESAASEWKANFLKWEAGERESYFDAAKYPPDYQYWEWNGGPPDREYYRPKWTDEEATWYQVYQTVSEGSPITPPFATKEELVDYLCTYGDFWDQSRGDGAWPREAAEKFIHGSGWAPSMTVTVTDSGMDIKTARDGI